MPVEAHHPEYDEFAGKWLRARTCANGDDAVKQAGEEYLPKLPGDTEDDYRAYKARAQFFNATDRTVSAFNGMLFRRSPQITAPDSLKDFLADAGLDGVPFEAQAEAIAGDVLTVGRAGTLVDWSDNEERPYTVQYCAEAILNWRVQRIGGRMMLTLVVLAESVDVGDAATDGTAEQGAAKRAADRRSQRTGTKEMTDEFSPKLIDQLRVLKLTTKKDGTTAFTVELWQEKIVGPQRKEEWALVQELQPKRRGKPLPEIPFVFHAAKAATGPGCQRPPLEDIINVNLSHYRTSADLEHGRHYTALPTPWITGVEPKGTLRIGSSTAWEIPAPEAKVGMLEFTGAGLASLKEALEQKEHQMAVLGAKLLEAPRKMAETAETARIRATGESSGLTGLAHALSITLTQVLRWAAWWTAAGDTDMATAAATAKCAVNTEFVTTQMKPEQITALVGAFQAGAMSRDSLLWNFERGEVLNPVRTPEDEAAAIDAEPPTLRGGMLDLGKGTGAA